MHRIRHHRSASRALLGALSVWALLAAFGGTAAAKDKVTLCHRVGGPNYVAITVAPESVFGNGNGHAGNHPLDIIPAFSYKKAGRTITFPGQNLSEAGVAILGNQCVVPKPPTEPASGGGGDNGNGTDNGGGNDPTGGGGGSAGEVALCHWHASGEYDEEYLAPLSAFTEHADHPRDVIPAFDYTGPAGDAAFDGQNLTEDGIALLANGCVPPGVGETPVPGHPLVELAKTAVDADGGVLEPGDLLTFTIVATNSGSAPATDVVLTDPVSAGTSYVADSAKAVPGSVEEADGYVVARLGTLAPGASATLSFSVRVDDGLPTGASILDVARASATDPAGDKPIESESNEIELPVDTPPVTPATIVVDPSSDTPLPGTDMTTVVVVTPQADLERVAVCAQIQIPPREGSNAMGTLRSTCVRDRAVKRGTVIRPVLDVRIPRRAAGQCVRLSTAIRAAGYSPRERSVRLCVRKLSAVHVEPVTG